MEMRVREKNNWFYWCMITSLLMISLLFAPESVWLTAESQTESGEILFCSCRLTWVCLGCFITNFIQWIISLSPFSMTTSLSSCFSHWIMHDPENHKDHPTQSSSIDDCLTRKWNLQRSWKKFRSRNLMKKKTRKPCNSTGDRSMK